MACRPSVGSVAVPFVPGAVDDGATFGAWPTLRMLRWVIGLVAALGGCGIGSPSTRTTPSPRPQTVDVGNGNDATRVEPGPESNVPDHETLLTLLQRSEHRYLEHASCRRFGIYSGLIALGGFVVMNVESSHTLGSRCDLRDGEAWCRTCFDVGGGVVGIAYRVRGAGSAMSLVPQSLHCLEPGEAAPDQGEGCDKVTRHDKRAPLLAPSLSDVDREYVSARWVGPLQSCVEHLAGSNVSGVAVLNLWLTRGAVATVDYEADPAVAPALPCLREALTGQAVLPGGGGHLVVELDVGGAHLIRRVRTHGSAP